MERPSSRLERLGLVVAAWVIRSVVRVLTRTWCIELRGDTVALDHLRSGDRAFVLSFWHDRSPLAAGLLLRHVLHRAPVTLLASHSRDGELVTRVARPWGVSLVRGSASRGGREAIRLIYRKLVNERSSPLLIPDGPKGPQYHFKVGVVVVAQMAGVAVLPIGLAASRSWRLRSWDRMIVPKPFARVCVEVGSPRVVERNDDLDGSRAALEHALNEATAAAERTAAGSTPA